MRRQHLPTLTDQIVGDNIRRLRQEKGILSREIASYLGTYGRNFSAIEAGLVRPPAAKLLLLADALECTLSEFFVNSYDQGV